MSMTADAAPADAQATPAFSLELTTKLARARVGARS